MYGGRPSQFGVSLVRPHLGRLIAILRLVDACAIGFTLLVANLFYGEAWGLRHWVAVAAASGSFIIIGQFNGLYRAFRGGPSKQLGRVGYTWALVIGVLLLLAFTAKWTEIYSRVQLAAWFLATPIMIGIWRLGLTYTMQEMRDRGLNSRTVAFAGCTAFAERLARGILATPWSGMRLLGFYDDRVNSPGRLYPISRDIAEVRGSFEDLVIAAKSGELDIIYITLPIRADARIKALIDQLTDTTASVYVVPDFFISSMLQARWTSVGDLPVLAVHETPFAGPASWLKRLEDIVLGSLILALIAIPMLVISIAVKVTSRGPVFFRQRRYGLNGEEIWVLKFRSMRTMDNGAVVQQATKGDPRMTSIGAFLRRTSLDELPQFINVLTGKMSIVGPRPHAVAHNELYRSQISGYMLRHKVKPGITGWAQVNGWRGETDTLDKMKMRIEHDLAYIRSWSVWLDIKIIFLTVFGRAVRNNAY